MREMVGDGWMDALLVQHNCPTNRRSNWFSQCDQCAHHRGPIKKRGQTHRQCMSLCMYYGSRQCRHCLHYWRSSGVTPVCEPEPPGSWQVGLGSRRQNKHTVCTLCARIEGGKERQERRGEKLGKLPQQKLYRLFR